MRPLGGHTAGLSPDAVKTSIDGVLFEKFNREMNPGYLAAANEFFFRTEPLEKLAFIWDEDAGVPNFQKTGEQEDILPVDTFIGNQKTKFSQKYTSQVPVSDEAFRADYVGKREAIGRQQGEAARRTQDQEAILNTYGDAFDGAVNKTPDGQNLASNSHVTLRGATVDNLETGLLSPDNLWTQTVSLAGQKGQSGDLGGHVFAGWVGPFLLYKTAKEVMNSSLLANSAENNLNVFDTDYGEVRIAASQFLGSAFNGNSNANTSYHLVSENHMIVRKVFYGAETTLIPPEVTDNDSWAYRVKFHEVAFPGSWTGYVGSSGSAAS